MTLKEMFYDEKISMRAINTCGRNRIETIQELNQYYLNYGTFKHFKNCGEKTNLELISLCQRYFDFETSQSTNIYNENLFSLEKIMNLLNVKQQVLIDEFIIEKTSNLSIKAKNQIRRYCNSKINLKGFSENIFSKKIFKLVHITKLGSETTPEIENYIKVIKDYIIMVFNLANREEFSTEKSISVEKKLESEINNLNDIQRNIINTYIVTITEQLTERSRNAINKFLCNELNINNFFDKIFSNSKFNVANIKNIGKGSIAELKKYLNDIIVFLNLIANTLDESELNKLEIKIHLKKAFKDVLIPDDIIDSISIFKLMDYFIKENIILDKAETFILKSTYYIFTNNKHNTLKYVGDILGVSSERVRQKRNGLMEEISSKIKALKCFEKKLSSNYNIDFGQSSVVISDDKTESINKIDDTNFSKQFIILIISFLLEEELKLIGNKSDVLLFRDSNIKDRHYWKNIYLINSKLHQVFYFENFIEDLAEKIKEQKDKTYKLNFKSYLSKFFKKDDFVFLDEILSICKMLINEELGIYLDNEENVVFERNTFKTLQEYAYEALEVIGKPAHIDEINKQIKTLKPDYNNDITSATLKRIFGFIPFGRTNVFGLKKWETEKRNIKGGTIRKIVEEFLENYSTPVHIKSISEFVLKYRPETNEISIIRNLILDEHNIFVFFKGPHVGLKTKNYQFDLLSNFESNKQTIPRSWEENYQELLNFILTNNKFPSAISASVEEKRISVWFYKQTGKINKNLLDESKTKLILEIQNKNNPREQKSIQFKSDGYIKLFEFVEINKRLPTSGKKEERNLYNFFNKQKKRFEEGDLDNEEKLKFIQIANLLQQYKSEIPY